jgi:transposase
MRFVEVKTIASQELQHLHRIRERVIKAKVAASNELRGMLLEYGVAMAQGKKALKSAPELICASSLSEFGKELMLEVWHDVQLLEEQLAILDSRVRKLSSSHPICRIPGVGPVIATAVVAAVSNPAQFKNGRQFAASLGLVPKHSGTGGKVKLLGISKRGDGYLRRQLIHGARSVLYVAGKKTDRLSLWATRLKTSRGWNRAAVALANKNARIIWALMRYEQDYSAAA